MLKMDYPKARQFRLGLPSGYDDVTELMNSFCAPLLWVFNISKSSSQSDLTRALFLPADHLVEMVELPYNRRSNCAVVSPVIWQLYNSILQKGEVGGYFFRRLHGRKLVVKQAYDRDVLLPSCKSYEIHKLSQEDFDLSPPCPKKPSIHCLNDDVLMHIFQFLDLKKKLRVEIVCRRWQALIYAMVGRRSTVDLNAEECIWRPVLKSCAPSFTAPFRRRPQPYQLVMYKMLILNGEHLTTLHLDEHRCYADINILAAIGRLACNLEVLSLRFSKNRLHFTSLKEVFSKCLKLKTVCLDSLKSTENFFEDLRYCKSLEVLRLSCVVKLSIKRKLRLPLKELSLSDVAELDANFEDFLQPSLRTFRLFHTIDVDDEGRHSSCVDMNPELYGTLLKTCDQLEEIQVCYRSHALKFDSFKKLKTLHLQVNNFLLVCLQLQTNQLALEDLRIELCISTVDEEFQRGKKHSVDFSQYLPKTVKSFTLPTLAFDDASYKSLLTLPNLERVFFKSKTFSVALLKKFVSRTQIVEIGAGMLRMPHHMLKELASLRRKALAEAVKNMSSYDLPGPLVLHLPYLLKCEIPFSDPVLKIIEVRGEAYLYDRVGTSRFDNEWVDFGLDFLQHELGEQYSEFDRRGNSDRSSSSDHSHGSEYISGSEDEQAHDFSVEQAML